MSDSDFVAFMRFALCFFLHDGKLWRKDDHGRHKLVATLSSRLAILRTAHDDLAHEGFFATAALVSERFWWPAMRGDLTWYIRTCRPCQLCQTRNVLIPPVITTPASLFAKAYLDTMHMPKSNGFKYLVQGRCSLSHYVKFCKLHSETAIMLSEWIFKDILCHWGTISKIVSDNGPPFVKALEYLAKKYHIHHIRILGYNSHANRIVERSHFDIRQALYKSVDGV